MPLKKGNKYIGYNISELQKDNKKSGKERGANGTPRSRAQIIAIAFNAAGKGKAKYKK